MDIQKLKGRNGGKPNSEEIAVAKFFLKKVKIASGVKIVSLDDNLKGLKIDFVQKRDICVETELAFQIDISPQEFHSAETVGDLVQSLINNFY